MSLSKIARVVRRGLYYVQTGSALGSLPLSLLNFATIFYYNVVVSVAWLGGIFTAYQYFLLVAALGIPLFFGLLGYVYKRKSKFFIAQIEVDVVANPYQVDKLVPNSVVIYEVFCEMFEKQGIDCEPIKKLLRNSGSTKYA